MRVVWYRGGGPSGLGMGGASVGGLGGHRWSRRCRDPGQKLALLFLYHDVSLMRRISLTPLSEKNTFFMVAPSVSATTSSL